ncbi:MAG: Na+/H+ antiporter NhaA, partial [Planctomycetales bacterium]
TAADIVRQAGEFISGDDPHKSPAERGALQHAQTASQEAVAPLTRLETALHPWVGFAIMPIFALANAGVPVTPDAFASPVAVAVMVGLVLGKPLGILLFSWIAVKIGIAQLPEGVNWGTMLAGGFLSGIGFTMALFVASLAFSGQYDLLDEAKVGVLAGSVLSAALGMGLLLALLPKPDSGAKLNQ